MENFTGWYEKRKNELTGGGAWLRGREINVSFDMSKFSVLISRLSTYRDTSLSVTHGCLYQIATELANCSADFSYLPPPRDGRIMTRDKVPWLTGTSTKMPWSAFGLICISNSIVQELINLPVMLEKSGIEKCASKRIKNENIPLIILGGANAANCAVLMHENSPVDAVFVGDDYSSIRRIFETVRDMKSDGAPKINILEAISEIDGMILPLSPSPTKVIHPSDINSQILTNSMPVFYGEENAGSGVIRISEGCQFFCSFCAESWQRKPYREADAETVIAKAKELKMNCGYDSIDLYSFNFNIHTRIDKIVTELSKIFRSVGLKSQRFDMIAREPEMLPFMSEAGKSSITCGLEGISGRTRNYLCKSLSGEDLISSIDVIMKSNLREVKIFLIATGIEGEDDFDEFGKLCNYIKSFNSKKRINFSITPLVRFPHTPLESEAAPEVDAVRGVVKKIAAICHASGFEFREAAGAYEYFVSQILLRGDKRVWESMIKSARAERFVYYDGINQQFADTFRKAMKDDGIDVKKILSGDDAETGFSSMARNLDFGVSRDFVGKIKQQCLENIFEAGCAGKDSEGRCLGCGACAPGQRKIITSARNHVFDIDALSEIRRGAQRNEKQIEIECVFSGDFGGSRRYAGVIIARALMRAFPRVSDFYRAMRFDSDDGGLVRYRIILLPEGVDILKSGMPDVAEKINANLCGINLVKINID